MTKGRYKNPQNVQPLIPWFVSLIRPFSHSSDPQQPWKLIQELSFPSRNRLFSAGPVIQIISKEGKKKFYLLSASPHPKYNLIAIYFKLNRNSSFPINSKTSKNHQSLTDNQKPKTNNTNLVIPRNAEIISYLFLRENQLLKSLSLPNMNILSKICTVEKKKKRK